MYVMQGSQISALPCAPFVRLHKNPLLYMYFVVIIVNFIIKVYTQFNKVQVH